MKILVLGGTRYFGVHLVEELLKKGHDVTVATRGNVKKEFSGKVNREIVNRLDPESISKLFESSSYDVIYDNIAYCSNDIRNLLDSAKCGRYIMTSSASVYDLHMNTNEEDFNPLTHKLKWCDRADFNYEEIKRQAECALFQYFSAQNSVAVRLPYVIGEDDYTKRFLFYIENTIKKTPINIDNLNSQMGFINSGEAGKFLAYLSDIDFTGPVNACSSGSVSLNQIIDYTERKTNIKAVLSQDGEPAPYNETPAYTLNVEKATHTGFDFSDVNSWIYSLIDFHISKLK